jgi:hypothetical protein
MVSSGPVFPVQFQTVTFAPPPGCQALSIRRKIHGFHFCLIALNVQWTVSREVAEMDTGRLVACD